MNIIQSETSTHTTDVQIFAADEANVSVAGVSLSPAPFVTITTEQYRVGDLIIGGVINVSLNGTIYDPYNSGFGAIAGQISSLLDSIGGEGDCVPINISCGDTTVIDGYGTVVSFDVQEGPDPTWTQLATYGVNFQVHVNKGNPAVLPNRKAGDYVTADELVKSISEDMSMSIENDSFIVDSIDPMTIGRSHVKYTFSISVTGAAVGCKDIISQKTGIEAAEIVVLRRLSRLQSADTVTMLGNAATIQKDFDYYMNGPKYIEIRNLDIDPVGGVVSIDGDFIIRPTNITHPHAFVEMSVEATTDVSQIGQTFTITGNIEGLPRPAMEPIILETDFHPASKDKITNAISVYESLLPSFESIMQAHADGGIRDTSSCIEGSLLDICRGFDNDELKCDKVRINNSSVSKNYGQGTVSFNVEGSTRKNCDIAGASKVEIEVIHNHPTDLFAEFTIPFRGTPLLQNLGSTTKETIAVTAQLSFGDTGCNHVLDHPVVAAAISCAEGRVRSVADNAGATGWYLTNHSTSKTNTGEINISMEFTSPYDC